MSVFRATISTEGHAMNSIGKHARKNFKKSVIAFNYPAFVKLAFNDAMTYNPETGKGGTVMTHRFRKYKTKKYNVPHLGVLENLLWLKDCKADYTFDGFSYSDYLQAHAIVALKDSQGPDLTEFHRIGREDAQREEDLEGISEVPQPEDGETAFRDAFVSKGFTDKDLVALSAIYMFGEYKNYYEKTYTSLPVFSNEYFKYLKESGNTEEYQLNKILLNDQALKEYVDLFAEDKKEFYEAFTDAYLKLYTLGNDDKELFLEMPEFEY